MAPATDPAPELTDTEVSVPPLAESLSARSTGTSFAPRGVFEVTFTGGTDGVGEELYPGPASPVSPRVSWLSDWHAARPAATSATDAAAARRRRRNPTGT